MFNPTKIYRKCHFKIFFALPTVKRFNFINFIFSPAVFLYHIKELFFIPSVKVSIVMISPHFLYRSHSLTSLSSWIYIFFLFLYFVRMQCWWHNFLLILPSVGSRHNTNTFFSFLIYAMHHAIFSELQKEFLSSF